DLNHHDVARPVLSIQFLDMYILRRPVEPLLNHLRLALGDAAGQAGHHRPAGPPHDVAALIDLDGPERCGADVHQEPAPAGWKKARPLELNAHLRPEFRDHGHKRLLQKIDRPSDATTDALITGRYCE